MLGMQMWQKWDCVERRGKPPVRPGTVARLSWRPSFAYFKGLFFRHSIDYSWFKLKTVRIYSLFSSFFICQIFKKKEKKATGIGRADDSLFRRAEKRERPTSKTEMLNITHTRGIMHTYKRRGDYLRPSEKEVERNDRRRQDWPGRRCWGSSCSDPERWAALWYWERKARIAVAAADEEADKAAVAAAGTDPVGNRGKEGWLLLPSSLLGLETCLKHRGRDRAFSVLSCVSPFLGLWVTLGL